MKKSALNFLMLPAILLLLASCSVSSHKNITYLPGNAELKTEELALDVFSPKDKRGKKDVFLFIHGGGWRNGNRSLYKFFGKRMARKNIVGVVISYPLSPKGNYKDMAAAAAQAIKWTKENISQYGGDPERIFISGHSAGGHIAALITVRQKYFESIGVKDPVKGVVLIDAAGLDMKDYLLKQEARGGKNYLGAFTTDHNEWTEASPIYHLNRNIPPMLIFTGGKTYPNIKDSNERFVKELSKYPVSVNYKVVGRKHHVPMIFQFYNSRNPLYNEIIGFMKAQK
ncbi:MAG TPA: alpha/beta hydrolase [Bacteroidia bacterium]